MKNKSFLLIGMGTFGHQLCLKLSERKNAEMMIVDIRPEAVEDLLPYVVSAKVGDCCDEKVLRSFGIHNFDACFVCIGGNFQNSIQIASLLKELGARKVIAKAEQDVQAKFLLRNGADEVIYPEKEVAEKIAVRESNNAIFDYIELDEEYVILEIEPNRRWLGNTIAGLSIRQEYNINILAVKRNGVISMMPAPDYVFNADEHIVVMARQADIDRITG
ncbi:MAG: TrkA family potassium uptake protein [Clostridia bacterium]|nr:TrkA family potassium uptake protein [Clostridia bacterium]